MDIRELMNEMVVHKLFGKGMVQNVHDKYLEIYFPMCNRMSVFAYPSCFEIFLRMENNEIQDNITVDLKQWKIESGEIRKEELRRQYEKTQQGIRERRIAAEEKKQKTARGIRERHLTHK